MKWSIQELRRIASEPMIIQEKVDLKEVLMTREADILDLSPITVSGILLYENRTVLAQLELAFNVTLPSTRSLEPVEVSMQVRISERFIEENWETDIGDEDSIQIEMDSNTLDLTRSIEDNIILNLPHQVLSPAERESSDFPVGNNWEVMTEDNEEGSLKGQDKVDPRLASLSKFFDDEASEE